MHLPKWEKLSHQDRNMIDLIIDKAKRQSAGTNSTIDRADKVALQMDLCFYHLKEPLDLDKMWRAPLFDLLHDVHGIHCNLNRQTSRLEGDFRPRFSIAAQRGIAKCR